MPSRQVTALRPTHQSSTAAYSFRGLAMFLLTVLRLLRRKASASSGLTLAAVLIFGALAGCGKSEAVGGSKQASGGDAGTGGGQSGSGGNADSGGAKAKPSGDKNTIEVPLDQQRVAGIQVAAILPREIPRTLTVPGQIMMDEQRTVHISSYADGRVVDVLKQVGDPVSKGAVLAHIHSHSVHETAGALAQDFANEARAQAALTYAEGMRDRYQHLYSIQAASLEQQQSSQQALLQAQTDLANAQANVRMEREHLGDILFIQPASITPATLYTYENVPIPSPIAGMVISRSITPGGVVEPGVEAYTVSDLTEVWMVAAVSETELSHLRLGQHVLVTTSAWPGVDFPGTVTLIGSTLDPTTRTVQVRATLANPAGHLKPQMFATAMIQEPPAAAGTRPALFVPEAALQEVNGVSVIFVTADGTHFAPRALKTLPAVAGQVEVTDGLQPAERVAIAGAFVLKSDLLKGTIGDE